MTKGTITQALHSGFRLQSKERTYEIVKVLGSGSFGVTYLATSKVSIGNISTTMKFAIKEHFMSASCYRGEDGATVLTVPSAKSVVVDSLSDFITEANRLKKLCLKSRNIVSVNETFEANETAYYVMEYLDGGNPSKCSEDKAVSIVMQIADALNVIHRDRVLHLDIKPDNIVLKTNDKNETYPVLIDFGISKHFDSKNRPTSSLSVKGASPGYAPQEQYAGISEFSPKYDIYALGAVLFFLCTGKNPPDAFKISPNQQELKKCLGEVSSRVKKTVLNAMKPNVSERTSSIKQFCDDLMGVDFIPILNVSTSNLYFGNEKSLHVVSIDSNITWSVYTEAEWCKVIRKNNNIIISTSRNKETRSRFCDVVVNGAPYQISQIISIKQDGIGTIVFPNRPTWWKRNFKKVYLTSSLFLSGCFIAGLCVLFCSNPEEESRLLTMAIDSRDGKSLEKFAELDSVRAYIPFVKYLINTENFEKAIEYSNKAIETIYFEEAKHLIDSINELTRHNITKSAVNENTIHSQIKKIPDNFVLIESGTLHNREYIGYDNNTYKDIYEYNDYNLDSFYIDRYELTQKEFKNIMGELKPYNYTYRTIIPKGRDWGEDATIKLVNDSLPVLAKYIDYAIYCNKRSIAEGYDGFYDISDKKVSIKVDGNGYRLPTSLEWTFAAKAGNANEKFKLIGGDNLKEIAWYGANSGNKPQKVGKKKPNSAGLYDMAGNIQEFMETEYTKGIHFISGADYLQWPYNGYDEWSPFCNTYYSSDGRNAIEGCRLVLIPQGNNNLSVVAKHH